MNTSFSTLLQNFSLPQPVIHKIQVKTHKNTKNTPLYSQSLLHCIACGVRVVSLVMLMLFTTTVEILTVRTGSVQSCHQTPIFPYRGRARQTRMIRDAFAMFRFSMTLVLTIDRFIYIFEPFFYSKHGGKLACFLFGCMWFMTLWCV